MRPFVHSTIQTTCGRGATIAARRRVAGTHDVDRTASAKLSLPRTRHARLSPKLSPKVGVPGPSEPKVPRVAWASFWNAPPRKRQNCQNCSRAAQAQNRHYAALHRDRISGLLAAKIRVSRGTLPQSTPQRVVGGGKAKWAWYTSYTSI